MHRRILFGVAAWLLGAATATAGSLLAVSLLGQGITGTSGPLLDQVAVNRALASEAAEPTSSATGTPTGSGTSGTAGGTSPTGMPPAATGSPAPSPAAPSPTASAPNGTPAGDGTQAGGTVLTSRGGDVLASCQAGGAYLVSWSPAQGFLTGTVYRGPAQTAQVTYDPASGSGGNAVTMVVSCSAGVPSATTYTSEPGDS